VPAKLHGKDCMHMAGEYNVESLVRGLARFLGLHAPHLDTAPGSRWVESVEAGKKTAAALLGACPSARRPSASAARSARCSRR
jgi:TPP-dependent indolepyruvate ferredoxin oxidoreductase alpha subunit